MQYRNNDRAFKYVDEKHKNEYDINLDVEKALFSEDIILKQYAECKIDNKLRLKQVKNLEDLVKFNIKTVADMMAEQGMVNTASQNHGLYSLRKVCDPLLSQTQLPQISKKAHQSQARGNTDVKDVLNSYGYQPRAQSELKLNDPSVMQQSTMTIKEEKGTLPSIQSKADVPKQEYFSMQSMTKLDENDPVAKLRLFFNDKQPKARKAPKHNHYIIQRIENQRKWVQEFKSKKPGEQRQIDEEMNIRIKKEQQLEREDRQFRQQQDRLDKALDAVTKMKQRIEQIKNDKIFQDKSLLASSVLQSVVAKSSARDESEEVPYDFEDFKDDLEDEQNKSAKVFPQSLSHLQSNDLVAGQDYRTEQYEQLSAKQKAISQLFNSDQIRSKMLGAFDDDKQSSPDGWQPNEVYQLRIKEILDNQFARDRIQLDDEKLKIMQMANGKNNISVLSKIACTKSKDYISYNEEQLRLFNMFTAQNQSQQNIQKVRQKRENYLREKGLRQMNELFMKDRRNMRVPTQSSKQDKRQAPRLKKNYEEDQDELNSLVNTHPVPIGQSAIVMTQKYPNRFQQKSPFKDHKILASSEDERRKEQQIKIKPHADTLGQYKMTKVPDQVIDRDNAFSTLFTQGNEQEDVYKNNSKRVVKLETKSRETSSKGVGQSHQTLSLYIDSTVEQPTYFGKKEMKVPKVFAQEGKPVQIQSMQALPKVNNLNNRDIESAIHPYIPDPDSLAIVTKEQSINGNSRQNSKEESDSLDLVPVEDFLPVIERETEEKESILAQTLVTNGQCEEQIHDMRIINLQSHNRLVLEKSTFSQEGLVTNTLNATEDQLDENSMFAQHTQNVSARDVTHGPSFTPAPFMVINEKPVVKIASRRTHPKPQLQKQTGYESAQEAVSQQQLTFAQEILQNAVSAQSHGWQAKRFKKFPRFSIYLSKGDAKKFLERNYISLSNQVIQFLAQDVLVFEPKKVQNNQVEPTYSDVKTHQDYSSSQEQFSVKPPADSNIARITSTQLMEALEDPEKSIEIQNKRATLGDGLAIQTLVQTSVGFQSITRSSLDDASVLKATYQAELAKAELANLNRDVLNTEKPVEYMLQQIQTDPFDKVLLLKNIDNAILTSYRTLSKQNNQISQTLKVLHQKFQPVCLSKKIAQMYRRAHKQLYPVSEIEDGSETESHNHEQIITAVKEIQSTQDDQSSAVIVADLIKNPNKSNEMNDSVHSGFHRLDSEVMPTDLQTFEKTHISPRALMVDPNDTVNCTQKQTMRSELNLNERSSFINTKLKNSREDMLSSEHNENNIRIAVRVEHPDDHQGSFQEQSKLKDDLDVVKIQSIYKKSEYSSRDKSNLLNQDVETLTTQIGKKKQQPQGTSVHAMNQKDINIVNLNQTSIYEAAIKDDKFPSRQPTAVVARQRSQQKSRSNSLEKQQQNNIPMKTINVVNFEGMFFRQPDNAQSKLSTTKAYPSLAIPKKKQAGRQSHSSNRINIHMPHVNKQHSSGQFPQQTKPTQKRELEKMMIQFQQQNKGYEPTKSLIMTEDSQRDEITPTNQQMFKLPVNQSASLETQEGLQFQTFESKKWQGKNVGERVESTYIQSMGEYETNREPKKMLVHIQSFREDPLIGNQTKQASTHMPTDANSQINLQQSKYHSSGMQKFSLQMENAQATLDRVITNQSHSKSPQQRVDNYGDSKDSQSRHQHFNSEGGANSIQVIMQRTLPAVKSQSLEDQVQSSQFSDDLAPDNPKRLKNAVNANSMLQGIAANANIEQSAERTLHTLDDLMLTSTLPLPAHYDQGLKSNRAAETNKEGNIVLTEIDIKNSLREMKEFNAQVDAYDALINTTQDAPIRMKNLIDSLYEKEKKYIYQKQGTTRADFVGNQSVIFNLAKIHDIPMPQMTIKQDQNTQSKESLVAIAGHKVDIKPNDRSPVRKYYNSIQI